MAKAYTASSIEVLSGLEPVQRRPGMYTDTTRPNHLAQEVIDNSVDEALAGHAKSIHVIHHTDGSLSVSDDGRGMPIDIHPQEKIPGVELILTRLHAGAKFSDSSYKYAGGLHGVGVSVVNALSTRLIVQVKRHGSLHEMVFANGDKLQNLKVVGSAPKNESGTMVRFWPDKKYFDYPKFLLPKLKILLRAKAVLCPGLKVSFFDEETKDEESWFYAAGLSSYLKEELKGKEFIPTEVFEGSFEGEHQAVNFACVWLLDEADGAHESYVNLIPTVEGGTHVNGLRLGLLEALREFCELRNLFPRGLKLTPEDVWEPCSYVISLKMQEAQFSGQTKERLTSRESAAFVSGVVKDAFSLWLNQHTKEAEKLAELVISRAEDRLRKAKTVTRKRVTQGPALPGKLADCKSQDQKHTELFLVEGDSAGGSAKQARDKEFQAIMPLRGKILNTWEVDPTQVLGSQEVHDIAVAIGLDPGSRDLSKLRYGKICILADADSDGAHICTLLIALFVKHFRPLVQAGHVFVAMPPLFRIDIGKDIYYALTEAEKEGVLDRLKAEKKKGKISIQRFKGLGEMNPIQLRETTMARETRRLIQLIIDENDNTDGLLDMLLSKKRASDRKAWLEEEGDKALI